jgi:hypothetical protein
VEEDGLRTMLNDLARVPAPEPRIDIARARRRGLRRLWARRAAGCAAALAVAAGAVMIPRSVISLHPERSGLSAGAPAASRPRARPRRAAAARATAKPPQFDPLVPYAAFGWLPRGYTEDITPGTVSRPFVSATDSLTLTAGSADGAFIQLTVAPAGTCAVMPLGRYLRAVTPGGQHACSAVTGSLGGQAPPVNGAPAYWTPGGTGMIWEYAPGAWAMLTTGSGGGLGVPAVITREVLPVIAASVKYGQKEAIAFPFQSPGLPGGWQPLSVTYSVLKSGYLAGSVLAGPDALWQQDGAAALSITADGTPHGGVMPCLAGKASVLATFRHGVSWVVTPVGGASQQACSREPVDGRYYTLLVRPVAGVSQAGGVRGIVSRLKLLGLGLAAPTTAPLGDQIPLRS